MDSAIAPDRRAAAAERIDSSSVLTREGPSTPPPQPSFAAAVSSTAAWGLWPVGVRYASDYFQGRPHRLLELSSHDHRECQNHEGTSRGA